MYFTSILLETFRVFAITISINICKDFYSVEDVCVISLSFRVIIKHNNARIMTLVIHYSVMLLCHFLCVYINTINVKRQPSFILIIPWLKTTDNLE